MSAADRAASVRCSTEPGVDGETCRIGLPVARANPLVHLKSESIQ
jgi:hypothetical protein